MRTHVLRCIALLAFAAALAAPARADVHFGIEGGIHATKATSASTGTGLPDPPFRTTWSGGVTADLPVAARVSLATGLRYVEYGERVTVSLVSSTTRVTLERHLVWRYLAVPMLAHVYPFAAHGPYLAAGFEAAYLLDAWHQDGLQIVEGIFSPAIPAARPQGQIFEQVGPFFGDPHRAYGHGNLMLAAGAGWEFPVAGHSGRLEGRYSHGLVDIARSSGYERYTRGIALLAGVRW